MELNKHTVQLFAVFIFFVTIAAHAQTAIAPQPNNPSSEASKLPANADTHAQTPAPAEHKTHLRADLDHDGYVAWRLHPESCPRIDNVAVAPISDGHVLTGIPADGERTK